MNSKSSFSLIACLAISVIAGRAAEPSNIIFDTDMGGDCDDVGALFILHGAVERGEAKLLATMGCVSSDTIAPALDAINTWFGRPEIPVGTLKDPGFKDGKCYTDEIARCFPHRFPSGKDYPDAVALYRRILANQPDQSVIVVAVGPLRNLANLLKSPADAASRLEGVAQERQGFGIQLHGRRAIHRPGLRQLADARALQWGRRFHLFRSPRQL